MAAKSIDISVIRLTPDCFARWQQESRGHVQQLPDGSLKIEGDCFAQVTDEGRLRLSCDVMPGVSIFLAAEPYEWSLAVSE